ncbi:MAG: MlaC/ttg2D family ABC transporter substrate-binding protein [Myxococcota bacterium]
MSERGRRRPALLLAIAIAALGGVAQAAAEADASTAAAQAVVRQTVDDVLAVLANKDWPVDRRVSAIEQIAYERFDFPTISRLVLARNYRKFSPEQREEFVAEFKSHLSRSYGNRVDRYEQEKVDIAGARLEPRGDVTVLTRIVGGQADGIEMNYRLREREGRWQMIDVVIEGVSLVSSFRSQFKEVVNQGGPELLLERLKDKNARFELPEAT